MKRFVIILVMFIGFMGLSGTGYADIVYFEDFDSGMGDWSGEWGLATNQYHSPPNSLADSPVGNYDDYDTVVVEMTTDVDLTGYLGAQLEFWTKYDIEEGFDYCYLDASSDGGASWSNLEIFNGEGIGWHNFVKDLGDYAGQSVRFRFTLETDAGYNVDGMYVDDFTVIGTDTDNSPPLILHEGPTDSTSVPGDHIAVATITDATGVESAWLTFSVDDGSPETVEPDSIVVDDYYFTIAMVEAGAHVEYFISARDNLGYESSTPMEHYVSGTILFYDDGVAEYIYQYGAGDKSATLMTPEVPAVLVTGMLRFYTDINRPLDFVDVEVWASQAGIPGESIAGPYAVWPASTLEDQQAWTYVDFRGLDITVEEDFFLGYTYRSEWPVILGDSPAQSNRSYLYYDGSWELAGTDYHMRAIVDYRFVGHIAGIVTEMDGTTPIEDVVVTALRDQTPIAADITDADGLYILPSLFQGFYDVATSAELYLDQSVDGIEVFAGDTTFVNFQLQLQILGFDLISPADDSILVSALPMLIWHSTVDPDSALLINYKAYWDEDEYFSSPDSSAELSDTTYTFADSLERSHAYYWRVLAYHDQVAPRYSNQTWDFYIDGLPEETTILAPPDGASADASTYLVWLEASDPDIFDIVTYSLQADEDPLFESPEIDQSGIPNSGLISDDVVAVQLGQLDGFANLVSDTRYYWRVRSDDLYGGSSNWTDGTNYFIYLYTGQNPGPEPFPLFEPPDSARHVIYYTNFIWGNTNDPYYYFDFTLQYSTDNSFSEVVISISGLEDTSFAIPTDNLAQTGEELFWRVLAINQEGQVRIGGIPDPEVRFLKIVTPGDMDGDGVVYLNDIIYLIAYYRGQVPPPDPPLVGDLDGDCIVGMADIISLISVVRGTLPPPPRPDCDELLAIIRRIPSQQQMK
jgi:hypothetical protein